MTMRVFLTCLVIVFSGGACVAQGPGGDWVYFSTSPCATIESKPCSDLAYTQPAPCGYQDCEQVGMTWVCNGKEYQINDNKNYDDLDTDPNGGSEFRASVLNVDLCEQTRSCAIECTQDRKCKPDVDFVWIDYEGPYSFPKLGYDATPLCDDPPIIF